MGDFNISITEETYARLRKIADKHCVSIADLIRTALTREELLASIEADHRELSKVEP